MQLVSQDAEVVHLFAVQKPGPLVGTADADQVPLFQVVALLSVDGGDGLVFLRIQLDTKIRRKHQRSLVGQGVRQNRRDDEGVGEGVDYRPAGCQIVGGGTRWGGDDQAVPPVTVETFPVDRGIHDDHFGRDGAGDHHVVESEKIHPGTRRLPDVSLDHQTVIDAVLPTEKLVEEIVDLLDRHIRQKTQVSRIDPQNRFVPGVAPTHEGKQCTVPTERNEKIALGTHPAEGFPLLPDHPSRPFRQRNPDSTLFETGLDRLIDRLDLRCAWFQDKTGLLDLFQFIIGHS